jgi:hypothetical protein
MDPGFYYLGGFGNRGKGLFYIILWICLRYGLDSLWYFMVPVVPHKAVAEVSKIGDL